MVRGEGDGQSDSIPVKMDDGGQGRLADNEFVVPADAVSALGSGSSEAGARALYAMVDRIRQQAHGTKQQAKPVDPSKVLAA
jgi:glutamate/tyrosine decarboxylase-like PLP-dependent enzyme